MKLGEDLKLPEKHRFYVQDLAENESAPIQVKNSPQVENNGSISLMVDENLAINKTITSSVTDGNGIRTETWSLKIPLADVSAVDMDAENFSLAGIGTEGTYVIGDIAAVNCNAE